MKTCLNPKFTASSVFQSTGGSDDHTDDDEYSSGEEEEGLLDMPWSEGGGGGVAALDLGHVPLEWGMSRGTRKYSEEELQRMIDNLYGKDGGGKPPAPGAWGKATWRPARSKDGTRSS